MVLFQFYLADLILPQYFVVISLSTEKFVVFNLDLNSINKNDNNTYVIYMNSNVCITKFQNWYFRTVSCYGY